MKNLLNSKLQNEFKKLLILILICLSTLSLSCEQKNTGYIQFDDVENSPVLSNCNNLSQERTKQCFIVGINELIRINFNSDFVSNDVSATQKINVTFIVEKNGGLSNIGVNSSNKNIKDEITRILKNIPEMKPASQNGENVAVSCSFPMVFEIKM